MSLRIGLLLCGHVSDDLIKLHGDYNHMFSELLHSHDDALEVAVYDLMTNNFPIVLHACDGYIITGSKLSAYDDIAWIHKAKQLVVDLYTANIPTIGICFGHQLIAESLGGKVKKAEDKGWGIGVHQWNIKNHSDWMGDNPPNKLALRASHQDQVVEMPKNSKLIASSDFCPIAGFQTGKSILTLQGHPEFSKAFSQSLIEKYVNQIGKEVADTALNSLNQTIDSDMIGAWMIDFIKQDTHTHQLYSHQ